jgi:exonuclease III
MDHNLVVWNVRGLNRRAQRSVVHELVRSEKVSLLCLQETKLNVVNDALILDLIGPDFGYIALPAVSGCGGILFAWRRDLWFVSSPSLGLNHVTVKVALTSAPSFSWWLTSVYGPQPNAEKVAFLNNLHSLRPPLSGPWMLCGDFNLIYQATDKNNGHLSRRMMGRFRRFLNDLELLELHLHGRPFTWSNERTHPALERIDKVFVSPDWELLFPSSSLQAIYSRCSDHSPLLLSLETCTRPKRRFTFLAFWPKLAGFLDTVKAVWSAPRPNADPLRLIDHLLRETAEALVKWSAKVVGSIWMQIQVAKGLFSVSRLHPGRIVFEAFPQTPLSWANFSLAYDR